MAVIVGLLIVILALAIVRYAHDVNKNNTVVNVNLPTQTLPSVSKTGHQNTAITTKP